jgi:hypothetical protein
MSKMSLVEEYEVSKVQNEECFFSLLEECGPVGFYHNRTSLLKGYMKGNLYTVSGWCEEHERNDPKWSRYYDFPASFRDESDNSERHQILPCFCMVDGDACNILWVHERIQNKGIATYLLKSLNIRRANDILPESKEFWDKYFKRINS